MMRDPNLADGERRTVVEEGTHLEGSLASNCPIVVNGKISGEVTAPSLRINDTGSVQGKVKVDEIDSNGEMSGEFDADVVRLAGVVKDDSIVRAKSLEVKLSSANDPHPITFGACSLEVGEIPDKDAVIRASRDGYSLRPGPDPVLRASAPPAEGLASASDELSDAPAGMGEGRSAKRKAAAAAKRP
jgi:cytoskeletal protein CcmA (bactofilin family)